MLLALILIQLSVLVTANPFHKYPTVFLLDVGNEELEKTNTEQIRVSVPGGSVALRYPAIGDGNTIGHLRVSSIDFGTSFKANIVDGGPGYKYAVLVLMGNPGVPYDAVVTVQTVNDQAYGIPNIGYVPNSGGDVEVEEDANNSAEDLSDDSPQPNSYQNENVAQSSNAELMQSSVNVYKYVENEEMEQSDNYDDNSNTDDNNDELNVKKYENKESDGADNEESDADDNEESDADDNEESDADDNEESDADDNEADKESGVGDIHKEYTDDIDQIDDSNVQVQGIDTDDADNDGEMSPELAQTVPIDYEENEEDNEAPSVIRSRINSNYDGLRPYLSGGQVYYQDDDQKKTEYQEPLDYESPDEIQQIFNDGEVHNNGDKYRDPNNNNYIDSDDNYAVAY